MKILHNLGVEFVPKSELNYQVVDASKKKKKNGGKQNNQNQNFHNQRDRFVYSLLTKMTTYIKANLLTEGQRNISTCRGLVLKKKINFYLSLN